MKDIDKFLIPPVEMVVLIQITHLLETHKRIVLTNFANELKIK